MKRWAAIIVKSRKMAAYIEHNNLYVIPNGVDFNKFSPVDKNVAREYLGWNKDIHYVLFGGNPSNMRKNFNLAKKTIDLLIGEGLKINLVSLTNIPHSQIPYYLNASDCMLFTSFTEGSPNIVKEAIACNLPVVSVNVGDVEERLENLPNCFVTDYNAVKLAGLVKKVLNDKTEYNLRDSLKSLSLSEVAKTINKVYLNVLKKDKEEPETRIQEKENNLPSSIKI